MFVGQHTKISAIIYLTQTLKKEIDESGLNDPLLIRLTTILNYTAVVLYKIRGGQTSQSVPLHLTVILRLLVTLKRIYRDGIIYSEAEYHKYLKCHHPDVYRAVITKKIDAQTAYKWCSENCDKYRDFSCKLTNLVTAEDYYKLRNVATIDEEQVFVRELVRIIARYKAAAVIINSLNQHIINLKEQIERLKEEKQSLGDNIFDANKTGGITELYIITPIPEDIDQEYVQVISVDGNGTGCKINIENGTIQVVERGIGYKINEIVYFEIILSEVALKTLKLGSSSLLQFVHSEVNSSMCAKYYLKVLNVQSTDAMLATKITLNEITFTVPIWTRIYSNISPGEFDMNKLLQLKQDITDFDVQYAILKYGKTTDNNNDDFDLSLL
tara:strand:+ start:2518 stop:3669 length:1152 start_codon:yes stop_codon:yes gene_type:complete